MDRYGSKWEKTKKRKPCFDTFFVTIPITQAKFIKKQQICKIKNSIKLINEVNKTHAESKAVTSHKWGGKSVEWRKAECGCAAWCSMKLLENKRLPRFRRWSKIKTYPLIWLGNVAKVVLYWDIWNCHISDLTNTDHFPQNNTMFARPIALISDGEVSFLLSHFVDNVYFFHICWNEKKLSVSFFVIWYFS